MNQITPSPGLSPSEAEALSNRFMKAAVVTPLSDGSFAVFSNDRTIESMIIAENPDDIILAITSRAAMLHRKTPSKALGVPVSVGALMKNLPDA
jgi:hypothetical protein